MELKPATLPDFMGAFGNNEGLSMWTFAWRCSASREHAVNLGADPVQIVYLDHLSGVPTWIGPAELPSVKERSRYSNVILISVPGLFLATLDNCQEKISLLQEETEIAYLLEQFEGRKQEETKNLLSDSSFWKIDLKTYKPDERMMKTDQFQGELQFAKKVELIPWENSKGLAEITNWFKNFDMKQEILALAHAQGMDECRSAREKEMLSRMNSASPEEEQGWRSALESIRLVEKNSGSRSDKQVRELRELRKLLGR